MSKPERPRFVRRRQWIVNPALQYRFIAVLVLMLLAMTAGALLSVYAAIWMTLRAFRMTGDPLAVAQLTTAGVVTTVELLILAPLVIWVGIRLTHQVAGPLVRINAALEQIGRGDYQIHIKLRKGDVLQEVADRVNQLAASLRKGR
jgi:signal transduction histidine kinase